MERRNIYLRTIPVAQALDVLKERLDRAQLVNTETLPTHQALGRVTAKPCVAKLSAPVAHCAAMDGIAVRAEATFGAREGQPLTLAQDRDFAPVNTGHPMPQGPDPESPFNAVIMIEHVTQLEEGVSIEAPAFPYQHVRKIGEDIVATELVAPRHQRLTPYDLAALLTAGIYRVEVFERLRLAIIPTGDEVLDYEDEPVPGPGQVVESNSVMLQALAKEQGCEVRRVPPVADDPAALAAAARQALEEGAHGVILCAGSSAGSRDYTRQVLEELGEVLVHGLAVMPGKPSLFGIARTGQLLAGAPGYPVSAAVCFKEVLAPLIRWLTRAPEPPKNTVEATLTRAVASKPGLTEVVRLAIGRVGGEYVATPLSRGAGLISSLTKAQGLARVAELSEGLEAGTRVEAELLTTPAALERTLVVTGSHDPALDELADLLMQADDPVTLAASHVGSMGGISALAKGMALAAGAHLLDPDTGDFNFPFMEKYAPGLDITVVNLAIRHQGLMVASGNPKNIVAMDDLAREDVTFVNRQRGAGTRILLDYHLKQAALEPAQVRGYGHEEFTHMGVAAAVASGAADCGLGVLSAARALGLDFVELARERYDLLIPTTYMDDPRIAPLLEAVRSPAFGARLAELGGYETSFTGQVMRPGQGLEG